MSINNKLTFSEGLAELSGKKKGTRGEAVKAIWAYAASEDLKIGGGKFKVDSFLREELGAKGKTLDLGGVAKLVSANVEA